MFMTALTYLTKQPKLALEAIVSDPMEAWIRFQDVYADRRERGGAPCRYEAEGDWEERLHRALGVPWPCEQRSEFGELWSSVIDELIGRGLKVGPESFKYWNDGDPGLVRALWCLIRHLRPERVVETGVAHGVTSRFILEALERNGAGHLWSIDLPPIDPEWRWQVGIAVDPRLGHRWSYVQGSSRRRLCGVLAGLGPIDLFVHDSLHSARNVLFELEHAFPAVREGGALVVDDIDANCGFHQFIQGTRGQKAMVCEAEPISPDLRRFNNKGLFGLILKGMPG